MPLITVGPMSPCVSTYSRIFSNAAAQHITYAASPLKTAFELSLPVVTRVAPAALRDVVAQPGHCE